MKYQVFESGRPAQYPNCKVAPCWNNSTFNSFIEAYNYAKNWCGNFWPGSLILNKPVDISGYGDTIEIRRID